MALAATSRTEKRARVLHVIAAHPTASNREIGRLAGVDHKTVAALRRSGGETEIPHSGGIKASRQIPRSPMNGEISQPKTPQGGRLKIPHSNNPVPRRGNPRPCRLARHSPDRGNRAPDSARALARLGLEADASRGFRGSELRISAHGVTTRAVRIRTTQKNG